MKCTNCKNYIPSIKKDEYFEEYLAIMELLQDLSDEKDKNFLLYFLNNFEKDKKICSCCFDKIKEFKEELLTKSIVQTKEKDKLLDNNHKLILINTKISLDDMKLFLSNEQKKMYINNNTFTFMYIDELKEQIKIWNEQKNLESIQKIKKMDYLVIVDYTIGEVKNYIDDQIIQIIKARKIYDKTTYLLYNLEYKNKGASLENEMKRYDAETYKWFLKNINDTKELKKIRNDFILKEIDNKKGEDNE